MKRFFNILLIILGIAGFAGFTIFILLYAQGKTFDTSTGFTETGIIRINSNPKDVDVYINGEKRDMVESKVDNLKSGKVNVTLRKDGYYDWSKEVIVEAGILKDVFSQMIPTTIELTEVTNEEIIHFIPSNINDFIYYISQENNITDLKKIKVRRDFLDFAQPTPTIVKTLSTTELELLTKSEIVLVSPNNSLLVFSNNSNNLTGLVNLDNGEISYISDLPTKLNSSLSWLSGSNSLLVTSAGNLTYEYNLNTKISTIVTFEPVGIYRSANFVILKNASVGVYENQRTTPLTTNAAINTVLNSSINIIPSQITNKIFATQDVQKHISIYDLNRNLTLKSKLTGDIIYSSPDATHHIVSNEGNIFAIGFEYSIATSEYKLIEGALLNSEVLKPEDIVSYEFYNNSKNILYSAKTNIFTSDVDGGNFREISIPEGYNVLEANITSDNQFIYTILRDEATAAIEIYKISIVLK